MALWHKRAIYSTAVWVIASTIFLVAASSGDGPAELESGSIQRSIGGLGLHFLIRFLTRHREGCPSTVVDERDKSIDQKATEISRAMTSLVMYSGVGIRAQG